MLLYDNLEDAKTKLVNTICTHQGKAVLVNKVSEVEKPGNFIISCVQTNVRSHISVNLADPDFNYMKFNIGYSNHGHSAGWWYRIPVKQYRQGLKSEQMRLNVSNPHFRDIEFQFNRPIADMVENKYPSFVEAEVMLKRGEAHILAFHKDFACTWDEIHHDLIVEYKGKKIGSMISPNNFKLLSDYTFLTEALREACNVH
jgi:hypothetical protein